MKVTLTEIQNNLQETNREGKEFGMQTNNLEHKEEINIQLEQKEETRIQKKPAYKTTLWHLQKVPTSESQGCQKEKSKNKKLKAYLKK